MSSKKSLHVSYKITTLMEKRLDRRFTLKRNNEAMNPANVRKRKREENSQKKKTPGNGVDPTGDPPNQEVQVILRTFLRLLTIARPHALTFEVAW